MTPKKAEGGGVTTEAFRLVPPLGGLNSTSSPSEARSFLARLAGYLFTPVRTQMHHLQISQVQRPLTEGF